MNPDDNSRPHTKSADAATEVEHSIDQAPVFIWRFQTNGFVDFVCRGGLEYAGVSLEEIKGLNWRDANLLHPDDRRSVSDAWSAISASGQSGELEARMRSFDGEYKWFLFRVAPLRDDARRLIAWMGVAVDIDARRRSEDQLRRSRSYLAQAQKLSQTGTFSWKPATGELIWSDEVYSILNYGHAVTPRMSLVFDRIHPEDRPAVGGILERALKNPESLDFEHRLLLPDGTVKHLHVMAQPVRDGSGGLEFVAAASDVTAWKSAQENIRRSESDLRRIVDLIPQMIWVAAADGIPMSANQGALDYTGLRLDEVPRLGPKGQPLFHPEDVERLWDFRQASLIRGAPFQMEHRVLGKHGEYRWFLFHYNSLKDERGEVVRWYITGTDIDERKQAEDKLRDEERELRQIIDASPNIVLVLDPAGELLGANQVLLDYAGLGMAGLPGASFAGRLTHPEDVARTQAEREEALARGKPFKVEQRVLGKDGRFRWFLFHYGPFRDQSGRIARWYATGIDIDDRKRSEEKTRNENLALREEIDRTSMFEEIVGSAQSLRVVLRQVAQVAPTDSTVLILGETGTGKELIARAVHQRSKRAERPFVRVNCAALPAALILSELFGHEKGAFTGAVQQRLGRFELADGGTIFLDEIGDLPIGTQIALLRVLQEREFERVGGRAPISVNVRVLAATNRDLTAAVASGAFRDDLFYRLNVFPIRVPALRERAGDIPLLLEYLIERYAKTAGKRIGKIEPNTLSLFRSYHWPGNIRELQNVVERAVILCDGTTFSVDEKWFASAAVDTPFEGSLRRDEQRERELIEAALSASGGRVSGPSGAALKLGIPRQTLESKIVSLGIDKHRFKSV